MVSAAAAPWDYVVDREIAERELAAAAFLLTEEDVLVLAVGDGCVLLYEVAALDSDLALVGPGAAELALGAGEDGARVGVDGQLRDVAGG